jgi:hypothetical protein
MHRLSRSLSVSAIEVKRLRKDFLSVTRKAIIIFLPEYQTFRKIYRTITSPALYRREIFSHIEGKPNDEGFKNRARRKIFGSKVQEVTGDRIKLDNEALYLY